jgi:hypothetical protein
MPIRTLLTCLNRRLRRRSRAQAQRRLLERADRYQPTQPSYAAELRDAALRHH